MRSYYLASAGVERAIMELYWTATQGSPFIPKDSAYIDYDFPTGKVRVEMIPESAKLDVNRISAEDLNRLDELPGGGPHGANTIANAIVDWRSPAGGASDGYYVSLGPSFQPSHASFQEIEELLAVEGVTPDIFYGTWAPAANGDASTSPLVRHTGLNDCLTVYGSPGGVDVNTAEPAVMATAGVPEDAIAAIMGRRQEAAANQDLMGVAQNMGAGGGLRTQGNSIVTFRATARLKLANGQYSDMRRTVGAQVKFVPFGSADRPYFVLRWYDTTWSY